MPYDKAPHRNFFYKVSYKNSTPTLTILLLEMETLFLNNLSFLTMLMPLSFLLAATYTCLSPLFHFLEGDYNH
ncbi:MAG TPA: hypothetical protein HPP56_04050 [Nitrospirae bacterium]|nr:hypothetical protein [Nitrospirota bacterium]